MIINKNSMKIKNLKTSTTVYLSLVSLEMVYPTGYLPFLFRHALMLTPSQFGSVMVPCGSFWMSWGNKATLMLAAGVPLQLSGSILHQGRWWQVIEELDTEGCIPISYPQWSCYCDSVLWVVMAVIQSAIWWNLLAKMSIPLPNVCDPADIHSHYMLPEVFTHPQWMLWWTSTGEVIASHWSTPGKSSWPDAW